MSEAPKRIWLQIPIMDEEYTSTEDITWCSDIINDDDTEYVRADEIERLQQRIAELEKRVEPVELSARLKITMEHSAWNGVLQLDDALRNIDDVIGDSEPSPEDK